MKKIIFHFLCIFLFACDSGKEPELSFDLSEWKLDKNACAGFRNDNAKELLTNAENFKGWPERQVNSFLGRPDRHRLSKRHQKFYVYFLEGGKQCDTNKEEYGQFIQLRFDATGYVSEVEIRKDFEQLVD